MIDLFEPEGLAALERLSRQRALYAFDYDGTLAPIVSRPEDAVASPTTIALLSSLDAVVPTAILTGRGVDDIRMRLAFEPRYLIGNHGFEGLPQTARAQGGEAAHRATVEAWLAQWPSVIDRAYAGIIIEPKRYSVSIHYRAASNHDDAQRVIAAAIARLSPMPRIIGGKCVVNLLPEGAPDKGQALAALVHHERCDAAFFIGDDLTDEAAFVGAPPSWVTVRVGCFVESAARYCIADQTGIDRCLERLLANVTA